MPLSKDAAVAICRAKLNLVLEILGRRRDGYHDVATVMHPIELADTVTVRAGQPGVALKTTGLPCPQGEANLVVRACREFYRQMGGDPSVQVVLDKRIPAESGLGGGSSDAAGTLAVLSLMHGVPRDDPALLRAGQRLGADVPFFLSEGAALAEGIGDRLTGLPAGCFWVVLAAGTGVSTRWAYAQVRPEHYTDGVRARRAALALARRGAVDELWNAFMPALARARPDLAELAGRLSRLTGLPAGLTGSGSGVYAMAPNEQAAYAARDALVAEGYWSWAGRSARRAVSLSTEVASRGGLSE